MFQRRLTLFALLTLVVAFLSLLLVAFYLLPAMSSSRVILAVDFEVKSRRMSICWFCICFRCVFVFAGIW